MAVLFLILGLIVLTIGADVLVKGAAGIALKAGLSSLVIGLTVVAFGTSAPELAVSIKAALSGQADLAVGNVVGSNCFNVLFILGLSALIVPLVASQQLIRRDVPVMIGVSLLAWGLAVDGGFSRWDGGILVLGGILYTAVLVYIGRRETRLAQAAADPVAAAPVVQPLWRALLLVTVGLAMLVLGAHWLVEGAVTLARWFGVSELLIGLTIIAAGTSLPEVATSVVASIRGERDIAIGNVVGSNIFNILIVLGGSAIVAPDGVAVSKMVLDFDLPVMVGIAVACLPIFFTGGRIARWEGVLFLGYYVTYLAVLILGATGHAAYTSFTSALLLFVLPLTVLGIAVSVGHALWKRGKSELPRQL